MAIVKTKKTKENGSNKYENVKEQSDMEIDSMYPPAPDTYPIQNNQNQGNQVSSNINFGVINLNEQALEELIEKEEENLTKKENSQMKSLEEIKTNLKSLESFFQNNNNSLYEDKFYADLKMKISK